MHSCCGTHSGVLHISTLFSYFREDYTWNSVYPTTGERANIPFVIDIQRKRMSRKSFTYNLNVICQIYQRLYNMPKGMWMFDNPFKFKLSIFVWNNMFMYCARLYTIHKSEKNKIFQNKKPELNELSKLNNQLSYWLQRNKKVWIQTTISAHTLASTSRTLIYPATITKEAFLC